MQISTTNTKTHAIMATITSHYETTFNVLGHLARQHIKSSENMKGPVSVSNLGYISLYISMSVIIYLHYHQ